MVKKADHLILGEAGEKRAAEHLQSLGWKIEARNWRPEGTRQFLELDIVARKRDEILFVEVKTRSFSGKAHGSRDSIPTYAAFTKEKRARLVGAADEYLSSHNVWDVPCRFDLICIEAHPDGRFFLEHYENVIELGNIMDSRHASWQPW